MAQAGTRKPVDFSATDRPTGSDALTSAMPWRSRWPLLPLLLLALHLDFVHFAWQRGWRGWHTARPARPQARDPNPNQTAKVWSKLEMLEAAPRLADARVASDKLFRNLSNGNETLPCTQALEFTSLCLGRAQVRVLHSNVRQKIPKIPKVTMYQPECPSNRPSSDLFSWPCITQPS